MTIFSTHLDCAIQEIGITQARLAEISGLTPAAISQLVSGTRTPELKSLLAVCTALHLTPNDLLGFHSEKIICMKNENARLKKVISDALYALEDGIG